MTENSTVDKPTVWYRHRVFGYALTARILLALRWVPPSWRNYLYDNQALASLVANPWWTFAYVHEELVDWQWKAQDAGQTGTAQLLALVRQVGAATTPPVYFLSILGLMVVDLAIAHYLARLFRWALQESNKDKDLMRDMPQAIQPEYKFPFATATLQTVAPLVYFANPFVILSTAVFGCFSNIKLLCLVIAMDQSATWIAPVALAIAMFLDVSFGVFAIALTSAWEQLAVSFATLHGLSYLVTGIIKVRGSPGTPPPPSLSVLWYTYMEFFSRFAPYLRILFGYLPYIVFVPLAIRLYRYPMALVAIYWMILHTLCQPVSTLPDLLVGLLFVLLSPSSCVRMNPIVTLGALGGVGVPVALYAVLHPLWLVSNAGEANFLYFQCLAYQIMVANILLQFVSGSLQHDKALRMTAKGKEVAGDTVDADGAE